MTGDTLLSIQNPAKLFTFKDYKSEYHKLSMQFHPDHGGDAKVFAHLNELYRIADELATHGGWGSLGTLLITDVDGARHAWAYRSLNDFELGYIYTCDNYIIYVIDKKYMKDIHIPTFTFASAEMRTEFEHMLPSKYYKQYTYKDEVYFVFDKLPTAYLLRDIIKTTKIDIKHIAWILSRLYNIGSYMQWAKLISNDISVNTVLIDPTVHRVYLLGGWWYSATIGNKIKSMPLQTYKILPHSIISEGKASMNIVSEQIHALGRELMGNRTGGYLELSKINEKFAQWLTNSGFDSILEEYKIWDTATLQSMFGVRKFIKWDLTADDVYTL
jgi:hypothetical protein